MSNRWSWDRSWGLALVLSLGIAAIAASDARAATIVQTFAASLKTGDNVPGGLDSVSVSAGRFDPALGTLTGVTIDLASDFRSGVVFYHSFLELDFAWTPRNYVVAEVLGLANAPDVAVDRTLPVQSYHGFPWGSLWSPAAADVGATSHVAPAGDLAQYAGTTPFSVLLTIEDRGVYTSSSPLAYINDKYVISDATLTVTYAYVPVPEPASVVLALAGALGLALGRAKRQIHSFAHSKARPPAV